MLRTTDLNIEDNRTECWGQQSRILRLSNLYLWVPAQQVEGHVHSGGGGVVAFEHEGVDLLPDLFVCQSFAVFRVLE